MFICRVNLDTGQLSYICTCSLSIRFHSGGNGPSGLKFDSSEDRQTKWIYFLSSFSLLVFIIHKNFAYFTRHLEKLMKDKLNRSVKSRSRK